MRAWIEELRRNWKKLLLKHWKKLYWVGVIAFVSYLIAKRFPSILSDNPTNMDIIIFIIWVALIVVPLFREVNIFGVGWKSEIDSLRNDFRSEMLNLRSEIRNTINLNQQFTLVRPPTDSEVRTFEQQIKPILEQTLRELDIKGSISVAKETEIPADTQFLFSVRYTMENELRRIWDSLAIGMRAWVEQERGQLQLDMLPKTIPQMVSGLNQLKFIDPQMSRLIRDVYAICSSAMHGGDITEAKVKFVRNVAPDLIVYLKAIQPISRSTK